MSLYYDEDNEHPADRLIRELRAEVKLRKDPKAAMVAMWTRGLELWCHGLLRARRVYDESCFELVKFSRMACHVCVDKRVRDYIRNTLQVMVPALVLDRSTNELALEVLRDGETSTEMHKLRFGDGSSFEPDAPEEYFERGICDLISHIEGTTYRGGTNGGNDDDDDDDDEDCTFRLSMCVSKDESEKLSKDDIPAENWKPLPVLPIKDSSCTFVFDVEPSSDLLIGFISNYRNTGVQLSQLSQDSLRSVVVDHQRVV